jgi:hypothetical protein
MSPIMTISILGVVSWLNDQFSFKKSIIAQLIMLLKLRSYLFK